MEWLIPRNTTGAVAVDVNGPSRRAALHLLELLRECRGDCAGSFPNLRTVARKLTAAAAGRAHMSTCAAPRPDGRRSGRGRPLGSVWKLALDLQSRCEAMRTYRCGVEFHAALHRQLANGVRHIWAGTHIRLFRRSLAAQGSALPCSDKNAASRCDEGQEIVRRHRSAQLCRGEL
jgi:hypothetical protein